MRHQFYPEHSTPQVELLFSMTAMKSPFSPIVDVRPRYGHCQLFFFSLSSTKAKSFTAQARIPFRPFSVVASSSSSKQEKMNSALNACLASCATLGTVFSCSGKACAASELAEVGVGFMALDHELIMYTVDIFLVVALIGAFVGGTVARQRKEELERLNTQLRKISEYWKSKATIESYAPGLRYAPVGRPEDEKQLDNGKEQAIQLLKTGKKFLREKNPQKAYEQFASALSLAQRIGDPTEEKKSIRGLGASLQRQGKYREAIKYHSMVLDICERTGDMSGNTEALGSIADCYCDLGELDTALIYYNRYIDRLSIDEA